MWKYRQQWGCQIGTLPWMSYDQLSRQKLWGCSDLQLLLYTALSLLNVQLPLIAEKSQDWSQLAIKMLWWINNPEQLCEGLPSIFVDFWKYVHSTTEVPTYTYWSQQFEKQAIQICGNIKKLWMEAAFVK